MKLKDYVEVLNDALLKEPSIGELEVYTPSDDEMNYISLANVGLDIAYVAIDTGRGTDEFVMEYYLSEALEEYADYDDFMIKNKKVIIL